MTDQDTKDLIAGKARSGIGEVFSPKDEMSNKIRKDAAIYNMSKAEQLRNIRDVRRR